MRKLFQFQLSTLALGYACIVGCGGDALDEPSVDGGGSSVDASTVDGASSSGSLAPVEAGSDAAADSGDASLAEDGGADAALVDAAGADADAGPVVLACTGTITLPGRPSTILPGPVSALVAGDFNGDGLPDLASNDYEHGTAVRLGLGNGALGPAIGGSGPLSQASLVAADFDGDGTLDLAASDWSGTLAVQLGVGDGTFLDATVIEIDSSPRVMQAGDFNGDGLADLVTTFGIGDSDTVEVLLADGGGAFAPPISTPVGRAPHAVRVADFNADGVPDVAVALSDGGAVDILLGVGDGTFAPRVSYPVALYLDDLAVLDIDGDGDFDLVTADAGAIRILSGVGDGTFTGPRDPVYPGVTALATADFDGDGTSDVVGGTGSSVLLARGNGSGALTEPLAYASAAAPSHLAPADFDGDGHVDLAVGGATDGTISILLWRGTGFVSPATRDLGLPIAPRVGDFNGDHIPDFVALAFNSVAVSLGNETHDYVTTTTTTAREHFSTVVGDLNGDGISDVVAVNGDQMLDAFLFDAAGVPATAVAYAIGANPTEVTLVDVDADGALDVLASSLTTPNIVTVLFGTGAGTFASAVPYEFGSPVRSATARDLNHDGIPDLIGVGNGVHVRLGGGSRTYGAVNSQPGGVGGIISLADYDGDGHDDAVLALSGAIGATFRRGVGDGTFGPALPLSTGNVVSASLTTADLNRDSFPDVVMGSDGTNVCILPGSVTGPHEPLCYPTLASRTGVLSVADFDSDGKLDVATAFANGRVSFSLQGDCLAE